MDLSSTSGEYGMGTMANDLSLGCDCLGKIHYLVRQRLLGRKHSLICIPAWRICYPCWNTIRHKERDMHS